MADTSVTTDIGWSRRYLNKKIYNVFLFDEVISTTVTKSQSAVSEWITRVYTVRDAISADYMIIGLDAIGPESGSYCTLQLCANCSCLIYQIIFASTHIPQSLKDFFADENIVFVGVDVESKLKRLSIEHGRRFTWTWDTWHRLGKRNRL